MSKGVRRLTLVVCWGQALRGVDQHRVCVPGDASQARSVQGLRSLLSPTLDWVSPGTHGHLRSVAAAAAAHGKRGSPPRPGAGPLGATWCWAPSVGRSGALQERRERRSVCGCTIDCLAMQTELYEWCGTREQLDAAAARPVHRILDELPTWPAPSRRRASPRAARPRGSSWPPSETPLAS